MPDAIAGDPAWSSRDMFENAWILQVADVTAQLKDDLATSVSIDPSGRNDSILNGPKVLPLMKLEVSPNPFQRATQLQR
jgi:hypothetical protein